MGCWNETCFVSHLPIVSGEDCYAVLMAENYYEVSRCYPSSKYNPITLAKGRYDDYGSLKNVYKFDEFITALKLLPDVMVLEDGGVFCPCDWNQVKSFSDITSLMSDYGLYMKVPNHARQYTNKKYIKLEMVLVKPACVELPLESWMGCVDRLITDRIDSVKEVMAETPDKNDIMLVIKHEQSVSDAVREIRDWISSQTPNAVSQVFIKQTWEQSPEMAEFIYRNLMRLTSVLSALRMSYHVPSGSGSQEGITKTHMVLAKLYEQEYEKWYKEEP